MRSLLAIIAFISMLFSETSAGRGQTVTVRATSALSDQAIQYLAGVSKPKELTIPAGVKPETFLRAFCGGGLSNTYQEEFYKLNGASFERAPVSRPRNVIVPGCVQWARDVKVPLRPNDTIDTVVQREIGTDAGAVLKPCAPNEKDLRCNKSIRQIVRILNPDLKVDELKDAKQIILPVVSKFTTIQLNEDAPSPETVVNELEKLTATTSTASPNVQTQAAAPGVEDIELIKPLNFETGFVDKSDCSAAGPNSAWPFNERAVLAALARNRAALEAVGGTVKPARIAILDTGAELPSSEISVQLLERNILEIPNNNIDDDRNGFIDDVFGIDARGLGKIAPAANYEAAEHGWYVADLATGGAKTRQQRTVLAQHLRLKVVNLVLADQSKFEIREGAILRGLQYASSYADIANLSVGSPNSMDNVVTAARGYPKLLLVIAAGNRGKDLNIKPLYPAFFGGQLGRLQDQAITVAAHGPDGRRANFSNFSPEYVDIAAPGCAIVQTSRQGLSVKNFGTSVAAPFVSFTAALIKSLGIENPNQIKNRLIASSKYVPALDGLVAAAGILDPVKAVSVYEDVVETSDKTAPLLTGKWRRPNFIGLCADRDDLEASRIRKITVPPQDPLHIRVLYENDDHRVRPFFCSPAGPGIVIDQATGDSATVPWNQLFDFVPGMRLT